MKKLIKMKQDPYTGDWFVPRRSNQKFETPENKNAYHNKRKKEQKQEDDLLVNPILKNRNILMELMKDKKIGRFHKQFLLGKGFDLKIIYKMRQEGNNFIYLISGFELIIDNNHIKIINHASNSNNRH
ncbi:MAG TPA: hypothetical protein PLK75_00420 [Bacteroidales bacterium]|nr:hypothetical protein [Bacteroidales bacterium]